MSIKDKQEEELAEDQCDFAICCVVHLRRRATGIVDGPVVASDKSLVDVGGKRRVFHLRKTQWSLEIEPEKETRGRQGE